MCLHCNVQAQNQKWIMYVRLRIWPRGRIVFLYLLVYGVLIHINVLLVNQCLFSKILFEVALFKSLLFSINYWQSQTKLILYGV